MSIQVEWLYNQKTEFNRLLYTLGGISRGFYEENNFIILPYEYAYKDNATVIIPNMNYSKIRNFWEKAKQYDDSILFLQKGNKFENELKNLCKNNNTFKTPNYDKLKKDFDEIQQDVLAEIQSLQIIQPDFKKIKKIKIYPTKFGTITSTSRLDLANIEIFVREDATTDDIILGIIIAQTREKLLNTYKASWKECQIIVDYILKESNLNRFLSKKYVTALESTKKLQRSQEIFEIQQKFLEKIGYKSDMETFSILSDEIYYGNKKIKGLAYYEQYTLAELIKSNGQVVSHDRIFETACVNTQEFSLYATNKAMQRIRDKLAQNNIPANSIQTVRGKGYIITA